MTLDKVLKQQPMDIRHQVLAVISPLHLCSAAKNFGANSSK
jgi:hypothetical protein